MAESEQAGQGLVVSVVGRIGRWGFGLFEQVRLIRRLLRDSLYWTFVAPLTGKGLRVGSTFDEMVKVGVSAVPIVALISFSIGLILAMQSAYQLQQFGATIFTANLVAVAQTRELGPLMTAIIVAGRSGSGIAAEIGSMKVGEEIDALRSMGFNPVKFLVVPKLLALAIMVPCLTVLSDFIGIGGGFTMGVLNLDLGFVRYLNRTIQALVLKDIVTGLIKSWVFALLIGLTGCYMGFAVEGGAEGVGRRTTLSVVVSIFLIILADAFFTAVFYYLW
ncbi:ABC transporter permease [bacterium]|nr:ABC transporter permease [bacterium]